MKVGILTFHRAINYGAVLQTLALQEAIQKLNCQVSVIDYLCPKIEYDYKILKINKKKILKDSIKLIINYSIKKRKAIAFNTFNKKFLNVSENSYKSIEELNAANSEYDLFITGSDQVWDNKCAGFDEAYFLTFVDDSKKKNSYAASYSFNEIPTELKGEYKRRLEDFNNISIREKSGQSIYEELLEKEVSISLDPTLLISDNEWKKYIKEPKIKGKYILLYNVNMPNKLFSIAMGLSDKLGYKIVYINDSLIKKINAEYRRGVCPGEFLGLFKNAEYVLTNSFHGTVFSVLFKKKFFVEMISKDGRTNYRSKNLLKDLNLEDRIIENIDINNIDTDTEINYDKSMEVLKKKREESISYLKKILNIMP